METAKARRSATGLRRRVIGGLGTALAGPLAIAAVAACAEHQLVVPNRNAPDQTRALATPSDVENLVASQFRVVHQNTDGDILNINAQTLCYGLESMSSLANADMANTCAIPRSGVNNTRGNASLVEKYSPYLNIYRAARSAAFGLGALNQSGFTFSPASDAELARDKAFGYFTLGVALGDIALVYDSGAVVGANDDVKEAAPPFVGHDSLMRVAIAYLDTAQQLASASAPLSGSNGFPLPSTWINGQSLTGGASGTFVRLVRSWKARFRAGIARTPADRSAVDWAQVISDAQGGITSDFNITMVNGSPAWTYRPVQMDLAGTWHKMWGYVVVMADSSGYYSRYLANPVACSPCLVVTPDRRFPRGDHRESSGPADTGATGSQVQNSGCTANSCLQLAGTAPYPYLKCRRGSQDAGGASFALGFSMYDFYRFQWFFNANRFGNIPTFTLAELNGLIAEGYIRLGQTARALPYINATRVPAGLPAITMTDTITRVPGTDGTPGGAGCVPKVPAPPGFTSAICGNVWEAMKWEKRLETAFTHWGAWWIDGRGWGDLPVNTPLEFPTPYQELDARGYPIYSAVPIAVRGTYGL